MSDELSWFKSSYSDSEGSACLEVGHTLRESSHSSDRAIHIRDSKLGARSPRFAVPLAAWTAFLAYASLDA
ncbi:DUF397 domain-containing protein [Streptomyces sp. NPDC046931]|uniref:DUF397 domain-containing protein n=1 Tax=Streptomyces sp. NPDC046931 TaxID=3154806 RepID=UPI0033E69A96